MSPRTELGDDDVDDVVVVVLGATVDVVEMKTASLQIPFRLLRGSRRRRRVAAGLRRRLGPRWRLQGMDFDLPPKVMDFRRQDGQPKGMDFRRRGDFKAWTSGVI